MLVVTRNVEVIIIDYHNTRSKARQKNHTLINDNVKFTMALIITKAVKVQNRTVIMSIFANSIKYSFAAKRPKRFKRVIESILHI